MTEMIQRLLCEMPMQQEASFLQVPGTYSILRPAISPLSHAENGYLEGRGAQPGLIAGCKPANSGGHRTKLRYRN